MGQRHQVLICTHNPINSIEVDGKTEKEISINRLAITAKYNAEFGIANTTVLAFHHQWLYGATAPANAFQVLHFIKYSGENNPFSKKFWENQYQYRTVEDALKCLIDTATFVQRVANSPLHAEVKRVGIENFTYLNAEEPEMRNHWNGGDNNDGCTIIDGTTGKYCFIFDFNHDGLKKHVPYSAMQYAASYYPNTQKLMEQDFRRNKEYYIKEGRKVNDEQFKAELQHNKKLVALVEKYLGEFEVLTLDEVKAIFPKVEYAKPKIKKSK